MKTKEDYISKDMCGKRRIRRTKISKERRTYLKNTIKVCEYCYTSYPHIIMRTVDPYQADVHNTIIYARLCNRCYNMCCADI